MNLSKTTIILVISIILNLVLGYLLLQPKQVKYIDVPLLIEVPVPGKTGSFPPIELPKPKLETPRSDKVIEYVKADSIVKDSLYKDAITERDYELKFKDSVQEVTVKSKVQGKLLSQSLEYEIYPSTVTLDTTIQVQVPNKNKLYGTMEVGTSIQTFKPIFKAGILLKNKKDNIYSIGFDSEKTVWIGGSIKF
ncbi:hypothetical protein N356_gp073 [Cellulophaga phage phi14:2]|uniref:Uncharacterized protein n=1 Tax=Cellulophaga phage phi14:2 TaxID=1327990 RepID=S0A2D3_9CAUD|nr:hypothetical protein N356_gp073 [Cellulophaga phage phi14:2]AGO48965.1 hypothetical protein Phi14:2_gp087 [Cellulophaga phage phi14:2]